MDNIEGRCSLGSYFLE